MRSIFSCWPSCWVCGGGHPRHKGSGILNPGYLSVCHALVKSASFGSLSCVLVCTVAAGRIAADFRANGNQRSVGPAIAVGFGRLFSLVVTGFALFAPLLKTLGLALVQFNLLDRKILPAVNLLGKFAMADIFLVALYITLSKGMGLGTIETAWGLYLFTGCIVGSVVLGAFETRKSLPQMA